MYNHFFRGSYVRNNGTHVLVRIPLATIVPLGPPGEAKEFRQLWRYESLFASLADVDTRGMIKMMERSDISGSLGRHSLTMSHTC